MTISLIFKTPNSFDSTKDESSTDLMSSEINGFWAVSADGGLSDSSRDRSNWSFAFT